MKSLNYVFKYYLNFLLKFAGPITLDTRAYNGSLPTLSLNPYAYTKVRNNSKTYRNFDDLGVNYLEIFQFAIL